MHTLQNITLPSLSSHSLPIFHKVLNFLIVDREPENGTEGLPFKYEEAMGLIGESETLLFEGGCFSVKTMHFVIEFTGEE